MIDRQMDGLIMIGPRMPADAVDEITSRIPTVLVGHYAPLAQQFDTVNGDDIFGAELVVRHLVEAGYKRIAMISLTLPRSKSVIIHRREIGYSKAMTAAGLGQNIKIVACAAIAARSADDDPAPAPMARSAGSPVLLDRQHRPAGDQRRDRPRPVGPATISAIVGYDNTTYCDMAQNSLTSVDQSGQVLGLQAARLLIERIDGRKPGRALRCYASSRCARKFAGTRRVGGCA
ncbi:MAG: substrate-binding domain-containing protein [Rubrivivax sp.]